MSETPFDLAGPMPEGTVVLEASAGTGKTFAIAHLFLRMVAEQGLPIERILVVTFTTAAAAELRDRIRARLSRAEEALRLAEGVVREADREADESEADSALAARAGAAFDPTLRAWALTTLRAHAAETARARIRLALAAFDQHRIGTIHGFCQRLLGRHAFESGADFEAELVTDVDELCREAACDFLAIRLAEGEPALEDRTSHVLTREHLTKLAKTALAWPKAEVLPAPEDAPPTYDREGLRRAHGELVAAWRRDRAAIRKVLGAAIEAKVVAANSNLGKPDTWEKVFRRIDAQLSSLPPVPEEISKDVARLAELHHNTFVKKVKDRDAWLSRFDHGFFAAFAAFIEEFDDYDRYLKARERRCLHDLVAFARDRIAKQKKLAKQRTFDDLLRLVDDALGGPGGELFAARVRTEFQAALIDEFQDTDPVQWAIFRRVFHRKDRTLLLIGDPKQAIYGFRGADLATYLRARREADHRFSLSTNHRSDAALLRAIAAVYTTAKEPFGPAESAEDSVRFVDVGAAAADSRIRIGGRAPTPIRLLGVEPKSEPASSSSPSSSEEGDGEEGVSGEVLHAVAEDVAAFLRSDACLVEKDVERPVRPADCAVLVRGHEAARTIQSDLRRLGVPAVIRTDRSVYQTDEARELELVLEAALHPADRGSLASALATDLVGATLREIAALETDELTLDRRYEQFRMLGEVLRERGFASFFREMLAVFAVPTRLLAGREGERRVSNLHQLCELLHAASDREHLGPEALLARLTKARNEDGRADDDRRIRLESDLDAVEIVTMHVAKGLEWGIVWCASLGNQAKLKQEPAHVLREADGAVSLLLEVPKAKEDPIRERLVLAQRTEELRLAYVAITRAKHLLHVLVPPKWRVDPFKALFLEGEGRSLHVGDAKKAEGAEARVVPDMSAAALAIEELLPGHVAVARVGDYPRGPTTAAESNAGGFAARTFTRATPLDVHWRVTSYTGLSARAANDRDRERLRYDDDADAVPPPVVENDTPWASVRGSRELGIEVHTTLEKTPAFTADALLRTLDASRFPEAAKRGEPPPTSNAELASLLERALSTPLFEEHPSFTLASVPTRALLREGRFSLPVGGGRAARVDGTGLSSRALAAVFRAHDRPTMPAEYAKRAETLALSPELRGFLVGAIDLVFEHDGRIYVADYKTTRLGETCADYAKASLPSAMMEHDYTLQALIYALAVHRHLLRREPGYDYDVRFGGVFHLFLRAMDPSTGPAQGVYLDRPPRAQLAAFERALGLEGSAS